jgi:RNA polymerase sigma factor (sigma-70 family)
MAATSVVIPIDSARQERISSRLYLVKPIAIHVCQKSGRWDLLNDMIQWGVIGLIEACDKFQPDRTESFDFYAKVRIRGTMLDGLASLYGQTLESEDKPDPSHLQDRGHELAEALASLPLKQREVVRLRLGGVSHAAIAKALTISRQASQQLESRAVYALRKRSKPLRKAA